ncbi:unnamed protein product [Ascophyllum nodosum]
MSLKGFSASVDEAKEQAAKNGEDLSERNQAGDGDTLDEDSQHQQLLLGPQVQLVEGDDGSDSQVESRTPPAMERNLFLSALANGKLAYHRDDVMMTLKRVLAGGLAGMLAKSVVAPADRIKILFQVTNERFSFQKVLKIFRDIVALEGPWGLWKGNSATMFRVFPYAGTQFMVFDTVKRWALVRKMQRDPDAQQRLSNLESLLSGSFAGATSALVTYPLDLARARLAVAGCGIAAGRRKSLGVVELLRTVVRQEGFVALYRGVTPSLLGIIPYAGIAFSINEQAKQEVLVLTGKEPGTMHKLGIGAFAGLVAQSCTYPLEITRRRMQTCGHVDASAGVAKVFEAPSECGSTGHLQVKRKMPNIFQTLAAIVNEQGVRGLFKGLTMNWVKGPLAISISFTTFDFLKKQFGIS